MNLSQVESLFTDAWYKQLRPLYAKENSTDSESYHPWGQCSEDSLIAQDDYVRRSVNRFSRLALLLQKHLPEGASSLDAGAGNGLFALGLKKLGFQVTAADIPEKHPVLEHLGINYHSWHLEANPSPASNHSFDAIALSQTMEHFTFGPKASLQEILRVTKKGGYILVDVPNISSFRNVSRLLRGKTIHWGLKEHYLKKEPDYVHGIPYIDRHNHEYDKKDLLDISEYFNLTPIKIDYFSSYDKQRGWFAIQVAQIRDLIPHFRHYIYALYKTPSQDRT